MVTIVITFIKAALAYQTVMAVVVAVGVVYYFAAIGTEKVRPAALAA